MGEQVVHRSVAPSMPDHRIAVGVPGQARVRRLRALAARLAPGAVVAVLCVLATGALVLSVVAVWPAGGGDTGSAETVAGPGAGPRADVMAPGAGPLTGGPGGEAPAGALSGRAAAVDVGEVARVGSWAVRFGRTLGDAQVMAESGANARIRELADGERLVMATVSLVNDAAGAADPALDLIVGYLGSDGVEYNALAGATCGSGKDVLAVGVVPARDSVSGTVCQIVPSAVIDGGTWVLRTAAEYTRPVFFDAS
ncbi:hypothetical protein [Georgenia yuyongxinii]|uniref:DUF4352 domain-containing protein n=1 Tax=Georgenia yuyongxinii TaxID=2589797 RepID=A0A552WW14_9MICO|nr:hypothetical protein [Georgenia yuyongxinii]TRW46886.1 hypothetical protein FJ693_04035 [Georgenia yuyongxinii]